MDTTTNDYAGLVDDQSIPAVGPYIMQQVSNDTAQDWIAVSTAVISEVVNGSVDSGLVARLLTDRIGDGYGSVEGTVFVTHRNALGKIDSPIGMMYAVQGVIVGVNEYAVQFADEHRNLHVLPISAVRGLIVK